MPSAEAPASPPTTGLKYESGTGIMSAMLTAPSTSAAAISAFPQRPSRSTADAAPRPATRASTPNAGKNWRTPS
jgi:hypothetical protein